MTDVGERETLETGTRSWSMIDAPVDTGFEHPLGTVSVRMASSPDRPPGRAGEDAAAVLACGPDALVLAVADGMGGQRGGARASKVAVEALATRMSDGAPGLADIVEAYDEAQSKTRGRRGAGATTLVVALITPDGARLFNVGDSEAIHLNTRGRIKSRTTAQSPVGYLAAAGALSPDEALLHEYRHLLSSAIGIDAMRLEVCPPVPVGKSDSLLLGSDGLFDNVFEHEILDFVRVRDDVAAADGLAALAQQRMVPGAGPPSKADDMSFLLFRPARRRRRSKVKASTHGA